MKFSSKILSQTITQLCLSSKIDHIVISPGSRNAPLTIGFTEHPDFHSFSIVDERCAAFFALGLAQQLQKPVALVCTSGSALLNYFPAVSEAFYSDIPLVVISADRPEHLQEIGDGQTIQQQDVYGKHSLYNANCIEGAEHQASNENIIRKALTVAYEQQGPVHINVPFSEPLYNKVDVLEVQPEKIDMSFSSEGIIDDLTPYVQQWNASKRKLILVGVLPPNSIEQRFIDQLATDESVMILTETTSNLHHDHMFPAIDQLIAPLDATGFKALQPEILLSFGGMVISKKIKAFLREYQPKAHWHVHSKKAYDTYFCLSHHFKVTPNTFLAKFLPKTASVSSSYAKDWELVKEHRLAKHEEYVSEIAYSDFKVFSEIVETLPKPLQLQLSNSATIRYLQLFELDASIEVFCNRGTSGIDGSMSTAIGAAYVSNLPTVFITGDLSFLYDSNALWNNYIPANFKIIVINNAGGGIFRILPGEKNTEKFDRFFETKHSLTARQLSEMYGLDYASVTGEASLQQSLQQFYSPSEGPKLLEIFTPSKVNDQILINYFKFIK
ncbi:2-succinyl-5-enolpyruvyl-6-hydroxy-3-cyclohexene-1-carboxylic-acid synthase [Ulvibacter litoralis]|uniref:2-succinyl-5-enolpyruvyl-6-hydroxy-3-cyclohexene-1-carboxylate synthase n=1 Tax=Ulvibacter litoralis TaxID=227084 RepID=A0A1G7HKK1_9FLAO|nr:2-succinyl-5-enolpyruvyl-6-hydroxy-3-cyclohexene-1-carboxylic-acid synthase [Ulvibacter litoralis]GHC58144.1 2-succinyl-5-enolpyruvyl-6-hydroxy-3-cyclohexene-1-carboxylate synthase [Ulvibacter litoralis]SDF00794.1 2-succinyl-5-enolpyruvyl-6-hydroxy-3-cyclohexene-1-carboxylate synthase [Ulvibacter litoralis]